MTATAPAASHGAASSFVIRGTEVRLPVVVRDASSGAATFAVSSAAAQRLIPGDAFEVAEVWPGKALCSIAVIEYRDNDLGQYREVSIAFFVREQGTAPRGAYLATIRDFLRARVGTYIHRLPVDGAFTCEAGRTIWGFPKTVERIDVARGEKRTRCTLVSDGVEVLALALPHGGRRRLPDAAMTTSTYLNGVPHKTAFSSGGAGVGFHLGGAELTLGRHPVADELRSLGLPKRALMTMWMEHMHGRFAAAVALDSLPRPR